MPRRQAKPENKLLYMPYCVMYQINNHLLKGATGISSHTTQSKYKYSKIFPGECLKICQKRGDFTL